MKTKGQGSTEYLIVLAIVIVVALIVVGVLGGIPGIGGTGKNRASAAYWKNQDVAIADYAISASGADTVIVKNNGQNQITLNEVKVNGINVANSNVVGPGASITLSGAIAACTAEQAYNYNANIRYTDSVTNAGYNITGGGNQLQGLCAA